MTAVGALGFIGVYVLHTWAARMRRILGYWMNVTRSASHS